jgi:hypothetical protein
MAGPNNSSGLGKREKTEKNTLACPYFMPVEKLEGGSWPHPARLPLGCGWRGHCTAPGHEGEIPSQGILESFCNLGYASTCAWAPRERAWDAVRFAVIAPQEAHKQETREVRDPADASYSIHVCYVCERDHRPVERGDLEFEVRQSTWLRTHSDLRVQKMAECFLESYLSRKSRAETRSEKNDAEE